MVLLDHSRFTAPFDADTLRNGGDIKMVARPVLLVAVLEGGLAGRLAVPYAQWRRGPH